MHVWEVLPELGNFCTHVNGVHEKKGHPCGIYGSSLGYTSRLCLRVKTVHNDLFPSMVTDYSKAISEKIYAQVLTGYIPTTPAAQLYLSTPISPDVAEFIDKEQPSVAEPTLIHKLNKYPLPTSSINHKSSNQRPPGIQCCVPTLPNTATENSEPGSLNDYSSPSTAADDNDHPTYEYYLPASGSRKVPASVRDYTTIKNPTTVIRVMCVV